MKGAFFVLLSAFISTDAFTPLVTRFRVMDVINNIDKKADISDPVATVAETAEGLSKIDLGNILANIPSIPTIPNEKAPSLFQSVSTSTDAEIDAIELFLKQAKKIEKVVPEKMQRLAKLKAMKQHAKVTESKEKLQSKLKAEAVAIQSLDGRLSEAQQQIAALRAKKAKYQQQREALISESKPKKTEIKGDTRPRQAVVEDSGNKITPIHSSTEQREETPAQPQVALERQDKKVEKQTETKTEKKIERKEVTEDKEAKKAKKAGKNKKKKRQNHHVDLDNEDEEDDADNDDDTDDTDDKDDKDDGNSLAEKGEERDNDSESKDAREGDDDDKHAIKNDDDNDDDNDDVDEEEEDSDNGRRMHHTLKNRLNGLKSKAWKKHHEVVDDSNDDIDV